MKSMEFAAIDRWLHVVAVAAVLNSGGAALCATDPTLNVSLNHEFDVFTMVRFVPFRQGADCVR
jgi:hypothetical protein